MPTLPLLKSGLIAQYPLRRVVTQGVDTISFLDGNEQRCATSRPLHQWTLQFDLIDEQELSALNSFVEQQGPSGRFTFTDPEDGTTYNNCSIALDVLEETFHAQGRGMTRLVIRENRD
jgi:phage-related protein